MKYDKINRTFDCEPTLTDTQVLQFCRDGYLCLQGVVPDEINERTCDYLNGDLPINPCFIPKGITHADLERMRDTHEPSSILLEDWYIEHVLLNRELAGALRSLLGQNVGLPVLVSNHRVECPMPAQGWHQDADHVFGPEINFLEVFYFPQDTPLEMGPTELLPGSHIHSTSRDINEKGVSSEGPAGSFVIHSQSILHRRGESTAKGLRHMLKYSYWRTVPPTRIGSKNRNLTFRLPSTVDTVLRDTWHTCSIGSAVKATNSVLSVGKRGPGRV